jgi:hypothetical protein
VQLKSFGDRTECTESLSRLSPFGNVVRNPKFRLGLEAGFVLRSESLSHPRIIGSRLLALTSACLKRSARIPQRPATIALIKVYPVIPYRTMLKAC